jgi:bacterioferritin (cytochrome b1)
MFILPKSLILAAAIALLSGCAALDTLPEEKSTATASGVEESPSERLTATHKPETPTERLTETHKPETPAEGLMAMLNADKTDINWLFRYYRWASTASGKALTEEYEKTKKEFSENRTAKNQWRLAMLLSIPNTSFYDAGRSSDLFKELTNNELEHDPHLNDAAFLMHTLVNEQHRMSKKSYELEAQLSDTQAANKTLQEQLDALKAIEDTLYQRNKVEVKPKP